MNIDKIIRNPRLRRELGKRSHYWFFNMYLKLHVKHQTAKFQKEMFALSENTKIKTLVMVAFRGSAKSTIFTLSYPIWAILGEQQKKYVVILSQTQRQVHQHLANLREELENNDLLRADLGPFKEQTNQWGSSSLVIPRYKARISVASVEQSIRGLKHGEHRPDLIICDDIEDLDSIRTKENRDKTYAWLTGDVIPSGDQNTRLIIIGNLLHEDSPLMRIKRGIKEDRLDGLYKEYPFMDRENALWRSKFPDEQAVNAEKRKIGDEATWQREYMLKIVPDADRVIHPDWITYYDELPDTEKEEVQYLYSATALDLAISQKSSAHFTAMVSARVCRERGKLKIYILPFPVNERLTFPETTERIKEIYASAGKPHYIYIEDVGYQKSLIQQLENEGYPAKGIPLMGQDKKARLSITTPYLKQGKVLFHREGNKQLIQQLLGFGSEKYDDLADAFALLIGKIIEESDYTSSGFPSQGTGQRPILAGLLDREF
ncbi:MAG: hypothetical protein KJI71_00790 [Patescibacteria group bacterium]|nr:hypothetical protein [Patescibacteria group bacterium]